MSVVVADDVNNNDDNVGNSKVTEHKPPFPGFGILCCIMSGVIFSFNAMLVKFINSISAIQISSCRCCLQFLILLPYVAYNWKYKSIDFLGPPGKFKFLLLRGFTGSSAAVCLYQSVRLISLGDAVTLSFSNVIFAGFLSYLLLKESFTIIDGVMSIFAMAGIVLIAKPSFIFGSENSNHSIVGVMFGLACGVLAGFTFIIVRKLGQATHSSLNVMYYSLIGATTTSVITIFTNSFSFPCLHEVPYIFLLGITGVSAQLFMTLGLHYERASTFAVLRSFQIVFVFILQILILNDSPSVLSLAGSALIFVSILALAIRKAYNTLSSNRGNKEK